MHGTLYSTRKMRRTYNVDQTRRNRLREFWPTDVPSRVLADEWGCTVSYVSQLAKRMGLPSRTPRGVAIREMSRKCYSTLDVLSDYASEQAAKRNLDVSDLYRKLLRVIVRDRLIDAILDDMKEAA